MTPLVKAARDIALTAHHGDFYPPKHGPISFAAHLSNVIGVALRYAVYDEPVLAACWLHDILEDTPMTKERLFNRLREQALIYEQMDHLTPHLFSDAHFIVEVVKAVTDEPGKDRAERKAKTYPKIVAAGEHAITVKLCDRIANVEGSLLGGRGNDFLGIYKREHAGFTNALRPHGGPPVMWSYLERIIAAELR